jgi:hypothetical protein
VADPPRLSFANHVERLVASKRSPRGVERAKALLSLHPPFNRAMILLQDVVQILDWSVPARAAQRPLSLLKIHLKRNLSKGEKLILNLHERANRAALCRTNVQSVIEIEQARIVRSSAEESSSRPTDW